MPPAKKDKTIIADDEDHLVNEPEPAVLTSENVPPPASVSKSGVSARPSVLDTEKVRAAELISNFRRAQENDVNLLPEGNEVKVIIGARTIGVLQPPPRRNKGVSVRDLLGQMRNSAEFKALFERYCDVTAADVFSVNEKKGDNEFAGLVVILKDSLKYFIATDGTVSAV